MNGHSPQVLTSKISVKKTEKGPGAKIFTGDPRFPSIEE